MFLNKTKNISPGKISKFEKSKKSDFSNFAIFRKFYFLFCSRTYRKNQNFQNQNLFSEIINIKPVRVQFTSPNYLRRTLGQGKRLRIHGFWLMYTKKHTFGTIKKNNCYILKSRKFPKFIRFY